MSASWHNVASCPTRPRHQRNIAQQCASHNENYELCCVHLEHMYDVTMTYFIFNTFWTSWTVVWCHEVARTGGKGSKCQGFLSDWKTHSLNVDIFSRSVSRIVRWNMCRGWLFIFMLVFFKIMTIFSLITSSDWGLIELTSLLTWASDGGTQEDRLNFQN